MTTGNIPSKGEVIIYQDKRGKARLEVTLERETVWLRQEQIAELFGTQRPAITKHLGNIFKSKELYEKSVCSILEHTAPDGKTYKTKFYNLDVIISVGYRVNSRRATQFRIWATRILRDYVVKGYALNQKHLIGQANKYQDLQKSVQLLKNVLDKKLLPDNETMGLLQVITDYAYALEVLDEYDHQKISLPKTLHKEKYKITYEEAARIINSLRQKFGGSDLFGQERDKSFQSSLNAIYQTFGGKDLYSSIEEKAAHLLYFVVKNHSFCDGNKRIAAALFICFLERNGLLYRHDGSKRIADNALVALTLMIASSQPREKEIMAKVVANLINAKN